MPKVSKIKVIDLENAGEEVATVVEVEAVAPVEVVEEVAPVMQLKQQHQLKQS